MNSSTTITNNNYTMAAHSDIIKVSTNSRHTVQVPSKSKAVVAGAPRTYGLFEDYTIRPIIHSGRHCVDFTQFIYGKDFLKALGDESVQLWNRLDELYSSVRHCVDIARFEITPKKHITDPRAYENVQEIMILKAEDYNFDEVLERLRCFPNRNINECSEYDPKSRRIINLSNEAHQHGREPHCSVQPPDFLFFNSKPGNFNFDDLLDFIDLNLNDVLWRTQYYFIISPSIKNRMHYYHNDPYKVFALVIDEYGSDFFRFNIMHFLRFVREDTKLIDGWNFYVGHHGDLEDT